jgi:hypothetical protein
MPIESAPDQDLIWRTKITESTPGMCDCTFTAALLNVRMPASVTVADGQLATVVPLQLTPATRYAAVFVNGQQQDLGGLTAPCYFSSNGGVTASTLGAGGTLAAGDQLYWNGSIAGFQLATTDVITLDYFEAS